MTTLEKIKLACQKANPSILELKFGCRILVQLPNLDHILKTIVAVGYNGAIRFNYAPFWSTKEQIKFDRGFEILGRFIQLADILFMFQKLKLNAYVQESGKFHCEGYSTAPGIIWNLLEPLDNQKPEVWDFIYSLLEK